MHIYMHIYVYMYVFIYCLVVLVLRPYPVVVKAFFWIFTQESFLEMLWRPYEMPKI